MVTAPKRQSPVTVINGQLTSQLSAGDRGLSYGDGLFETCRLARGQIPLWPEHCRRLLASAAHLHIPLSKTILEHHYTLLSRHVSDFAARSGTLKIILTRGVGGRGYAQLDTLEPTLVMQLFPDERSNFAPEKPIAVRLCRMRLGSNPALAGHKHLNRLENVLARAEWDDTRIGEGIVCDSQDNIIECTAHNIFIKRDNVWFTPSLHQCGVKGVMRDLLIKHLAPAAGIAIQETNIHLSQLSEAQAVFICNSNRGIVPVSKVLDESGQLLCEFASSTQALHTALQDHLQRRGLSARDTNL